MFLIMAVAALLAALVQLPGIVGAFLAGLAVNAAVHDKPAKEKVKFFGEALFVPCFVGEVGEAFELDLLDGHLTVREIPVDETLMASRTRGSSEAARSVGRRADAALVAAAGGLKSNVVDSLTSAQA
jgi:hypothetical protein